MTQDTQIARIATATGYDSTKIALIKETIARGASDDELMLFLHLAQRSGLDPFSRQIYLIERQANIKGQWVTTRQPQTGIDGLRLIADRTERYAPGHEPSFGYGPDGQLDTATSYVKKWVRGEWHEVAATAHYREYMQSKSDGKPTKMWAEKPHIMLAKCAEALALRRAFPAEMIGLYTSDEIHSAGTDALPAANVITGEIIDSAPKMTDPQRKMLFAVYKEGNYEDTLEQWIQIAFGCRVSELTIQQAREAIETLKTPVEEVQV